MIQESLGPELAPTPEPEIRFAMDKSDDGRVTQVRLVQLSLDGEPLYVWPIWTSDASITSIDSVLRPEAIEMDEPTVRMPEDEEREKIESENPDEKEEGA